MASFELKILTEDPTELKALVDKLCTQVNNGGYVSPQELQAVATGHTTEPGTIADQAKYDAAKAAGVVAEVVVTTADPVSKEVADAVSSAMPASVPERDAEGLKRDSRIHSDAAEPFKADGTWKRKRNTPDDVYESVYEELAREAHAAGLYKGPLLGQFELEARVVDTEQAPAPVVEQQAAPAPAVESAPAPAAPVVEQSAPAPVAPAPAVSPAPVAPAPAPQAAPAGLSAQVSASEQRCKDLLTSMIKQVGPTVAVASLRMFGGAHAITVLTPEQREQFCNVAEALIASGATATDGSDKLAEIAVLMGVAV